LNVMPFGEYPASIANRREARFQASWATLALSNAPCWTYQVPVSGAFTWYAAVAVPLSGDAEADASLTGPSAGRSMIAGKAWTISCRGPNDIFGRPAPTCATAGSAAAKACCGTLG
jgi:hypothetical protein